MTRKYADVKALPPPVTVEDYENRIDLLESKLNGGLDWAYADLIAIYKKELGKLKAKSLK